MNILFKILCIAALSISLAACASNDIRWTEEVKLSDGRIVQLQRHTEMTSHSGFPANRRGLYKSHEICYAPMNLHWKSSGGYRPDIFDIVDGKAYMHVPIYGCFQCKLHDYPETDALYFVWDNRTWKQIKHDEFPEAPEWNLLYDSQATKAEDDASGFVTLQGKLEQRDRTLHHEQKRKGWKRVNEGGKGLGRCKACRQVKVTTDQSPEIFINDGNSTCQQ